MTAAGPILIYGATGYTGEMVAERAAELGCDVTLAGRNREKLRALSGRTGLPFTSFALYEPAAIEAQLADYSTVLHLAGPYRETAQPMFEAACRTGTHYVDITGEIEVLLAHLARDDAARAAGIVLLTGAGFDVVPSDCLAAFVCAGFDEVRSLELFFSGGAGMSRGTMASGLSMIGGGTPIRRNGTIIHVSPPPRRSCDFGEGPRLCTASAWGDLVTAYHSAHARDITCYFEAKPFGIQRGPLTPLSRFLLKTRPVRALLARLIERMPAGPDRSSREMARQVLVAEATGVSGPPVRARLTTPEAYTLTAMACLEAAQSIAKGGVNPGFHTPATAFGVEFITRFTGVDLERLDSPPGG